MTVRQATILTNALLWAAAIIAAAVVRAPQFLSLILLPLLGAMSMLVSWHRLRDRQYPRSTGDASP
jgi:hypothetical protein